MESSHLLDHQRAKSAKAERLLTLAEAGSVQHHRVTAPFPHSKAKAFRIFDGGSKSLQLARRRPTIPLLYNKADGKRLAEWYGAFSDTEMQDDGLDGKVKDTEFRSIAGFRPDHLGFDPMPASAMLQPRIHDILADLKDGDVTTRWQMTGYSTLVYPWCTVGALFVSVPPYNQEWFTGSGFMFGGRVMFTARHIFTDDIHEALGQGRRYSFVPGYDPRAAQPEPFGRAIVTNVRGKKDGSGWGYNTVTGWDYAACRLDQRVGDLSGSLGIACYDDADDYRDMWVNSAGYPSSYGGLPTWEILARIRDVDGDSYERELETRVFASPGWSGGPLFGYVGFTGDTRVVGVCSGKESFDSFLPPYAQGVWAGGQRLVNLAEWTVQNWWD